MKQGLGGQAFKGKKKQRTEGFCQTTQQTVEQKENKDCMCNLTFSSSHTNKVKTSETNSNIFCLTQYIQYIISLCNQYRISEIFYIRFFSYTKALKSDVSFYFQYISIWTNYTSSAQRLYVASDNRSGWRSSGAITGSQGGKASDTDTDTLTHTHTLPSEILMQQ